MNEPIRQPCPECAEPVALDARLCPHCRSSALVDVRLHQPVADPRVRHTVARALQGLGPGLSYTDVHSRMQDPRPVLAPGVTRAFAQAALALLAEHGLPGSIERPTVPAVRSGLPPAVKAGAWALLGLATVAAGWALLRPRVPAAPRSESATAPADAPPASAALSSRELARRSLPSTVALRCHDSVGSGFFAAPDFVLTNAHVLCSAGEAIEAVLSDGRRLPATVVRSNQALDLALLRVDGAGVAPLPLGDVAELSVGDRVQIIGSPAGLEFTVHEGSVSSLHRPVDGVAYVQLDAKINPGNSGGPVIDDRGRVVGVVTLKHRSADGIGLALPINYAYSEPLRLLSPPDAGAQDSAPFQAMVARARSARDEGEPAFDGRPLLVAASVDRYQRLVVRVLRVSAGPPRFEEIALKFWSGTEAFCTVKGDVSSWTPVEPDRAESMVDPRLLQVVRERAGDRYVYVGESPLRWDLCDRERMGPGVEVELVGASPVASRMKLLN